MKPKFVNKTRSYRESLDLNADAKTLALIGLPRTGTSILHDLLNASPEVYLAYEHREGPLLTRDREALHSLFYELLRQSEWIIRNPFTTNAKAKGFSYTQKFKYWGDKMIFGRSKRFANALRKAILKNKINKTVAIVREPRNRYVSYQKWYDKRQDYLPLTASRTGQNDFGMELDRWNDYVEFLMGVLARTDNVLLVDYEQLVSDPISVVRTISSFLEVDFSYLDLSVIHHTSTDWTKHQALSEVALDQRTIANFGKLHSHGVRYSTN